MNNWKMIFVWCLLCVPGVLDAQEDSTAKAIRGDLGLDVNLAGVFVADDKNEIKMVTEEYSGDLIVTRIVPEGVKVKKGDTLITFDRAKLDEAIEEAANEVSDAAVQLQKVQAAHRSAEIDRDSKMIQLEAELKALQKEVASAKAKQQLDLDEKREGIKSAEDSLEQKKVDMQMLKDIYAERGLESSNKSGDILLERQQKQIENTIKNIEFQKKQLAYFEQFDKSKTQLEKELEIEKKQAEIEKQTIMLAAEVHQKLSEVVKAERKLSTSQGKVERLNLDRERLEVQSPRDGVVFYGATENELPPGVIVGFSGRDVRDELRIGGRVKTHEILMTVATMTHLSIKMNVTENDIQHLKNELPITVYPHAYPKAHYKGKLTLVEQIATGSSFYISAEKTFRVMGKCTDLAPELRSGMNCRVTIHTTALEDVVQIPVASVLRDSDNQFYCLVKRDGNFEKQLIEIGFSNPEWVSVSKGISAGDIVSLRPDELQAKSDS